MTTESLFATASSQLDSLIMGIHKKKTNDNDWAPARRLSDAQRVLQTQDNGVSLTQFECDDTLYECQPVCVEPSPAFHYKEWCECDGKGCQKPRAALVDSSEEPEYSFGYT